MQLSTDTVLYAQWIPATNFIISFDYQGATGGTDTVNKEVSSFELVGELPEPVKNGYTFNGWFTLANGEGTLYESTTIFSAGANLTLYAYWVGVENTLKFDANTGEGSMEDLKVRTGEEIEVPSAKFTKDGQVFSKWTTKPDGTGMSYNAGVKLIMPDGNLTLYAQYVQGFYLTYNTDGGINDGYKDFVKVVKTPIFTQKEGYKLAGWYQDAEFKTGVIFPITLSTDKTIYAKWVEVVND